MAAFALNRLMQYAQPESPAVQQKTAQPSAGALGAFGGGGASSSSVAKQPDAQPSLMGAGSFGRTNSAQSPISQPDMTMPVQRGVNPGVAPAARSSFGSSRLADYRKRLFGDGEAFSGFGANPRQEQMPSAELPVASGIYGTNAGGMGFAPTQPYERQNPLQPQETNNNLASLFAQMGQWGR